MTKSTILVVEDDKSLSQIIAKSLESWGYTPRISLDYSNAVDKIRHEKFDLIITDVSLPDQSGFNILDFVRNLELKIPFIIVTNFELESREILAYNLGANIFHKKPINFALMRAQISMLLSQDLTGKEIKIGEISIDNTRKVVNLNSNQIKFTKKEFRLLTLLSKSPGQVLSRRQIINRLGSSISDIEESSIDTLVSRVRKKFAKFTTKEILETVYGEGYRISISYLN